MAIGHNDMGWLKRIGSGSEMGRSVIDVDWARTPMGAPDSWPVELRVAVQVCLTTRFPMLIMWGADLRMIYNDGYRDMIGDKHPSALGAPASEVWQEIWETIGPLAKQVMETVEPTWSENQTLLMFRNGFLEETQFTFSYSPLMINDEVVGIIDIATEASGQVLARRRLDCLGELATNLFDAVEVNDVCTVATETLSNWRHDVVSAEVFLGAGNEVMLVSTSRGADRSPVDAKALSDVMIRKVPRRFGPTTSTPGLPIEGIALPLTGEREGPDGVLYIEPSPTLVFDADYEGFLMAAAGIIKTALESAYRRGVDLDDERRISRTLQAAMLPPASNHRTVAARYQPANLDLAVGGDWYDVIDQDEHRRAMVVGDCVGHGLMAATTMGQLRSAARALLLEGHEPAAVLRHLDVFAASTDGAMAATVVCAVVDRLKATVTYSRAGHPPPLIVDADKVRWLKEGRGVPLQVGSVVPREEAVVGYTDGSLLILYSDGLIERRGESIDVGLARLEAAARECMDLGLAVHDIADELMRRLFTASHDDDVVVVVKRLKIDHP